MTRRLLALLVSAALGASAALAQPGEHTLNLKDADIRVLIATVSEITGKNFIVDPKVEGKVNIVSTRPMSADEVYEVFESVLRVHGYAAVQSGSMVKIVPEIIANQDGSATSSGPRGPDTLTTEVIPLKHVSAAEMIPILRPLVPQQAQIAAHKSSNALIVVDRAGNIARIEALIARIDQASDASIEVVALHHANAAEMARTLTLLSGDAADQLNGTAPAKVFADARTNSLLLSGDPSARLKMRALIGHLDEPLTSGDATQVVYLRYAKAEDLVPILETTAKTLNREQAAKEGDKGGGSSGATIKAHNETNALVISADPAVFRELQSVIRQLDIRRAQVMIEGVIAEVSNDRANELGVQMQNTSIKPVKDADGNVIDLTRGIFGGTNFGNSSGGGNILGAALNPLQAGGGLNIGFVGGTLTLPGSDTPILQLGGLVRALDGDGRSNILSTPSIVTLDHQEALIKVGQEVPFIQGEFTTNVQGSSGTGSTGTIGNPFRTVQRKDVGLKLTVTPHINEGDSVRLDIKQEISSIANAVPGASDLITNNREIATSVLVADRQTLVLGGLISTETKESVSKVPALGDIPILGNLFRYRSASTLKRNLMVFLQPTILRDAATEASVSSDKYNFMRAEQLKATQNKQNLLPSDAQPVLPPRDGAPPPIAEPKR